MVLHLPKQNLDVAVHIACQSQTQAISDYGCDACTSLLTISTSTALILLESS